MFRRIAAGGAAVAFIGAVSPAPALASQTQQTMFTVEVTNISQSTGTLVETPQGPMPIPLSPGAFAVYTGDNPVFAVGQQATEGIEDIAEDGFPMLLAQQLQGAPGVTDSGTFADPQGPKKALEPGMSASFTVTAEPGSKMSFATMFVPSNDAFYGAAEGIALFDDSGNPISGDVTDQIAGYDAGTEQNQEFYGPATKPRQPSPDFGPVEDSVITPVGQVTGPQTYPSTGQVIQVTVSPAPAGGVAAGGGGAADTGTTTTALGVGALAGAALLAGAGVVRRRSAER